MKKKKIPKKEMKKRDMDRQLTKEELLSMKKWSTLLVIKEKLQSTIFALEWHFFPYSQY